MIQGSIFFTANMKISGSNFLPKFFAGHNLNLMVLNPFICDGFMVGE